uniref:Syntaxin-7 n=3 Tax=Equus TaxID=9789 RepID=F7BYV5_HORSE|nr:PREDICTED: syntaxin-7 isoform X3 [Equus przewalskii]
MSYTPGIGGDPAQLAQRISSNIQKITQCSAEIQRTLNQLGTPQDSPELRQQLQQKQQYTNQLAKETDKYIKEFGSLPTTPSEQRQRKIQKDRLVDEFTTSLTNFQKVQRQAAEKEKEFVARVRASSRVSGGFPEESSKEKNLVSWESQTQPQVQVQDEEITEDDLRLIHERESSIRQLEADIMDINEIFKDLGMMIHEQGDMIDSIEANVENAEVHVQQANQQLSRAADYQEFVSSKYCNTGKKLPGCKPAGSSSFISAGFLKVRFSEEASHSRRSLLCCGKLEWRQLTTALLWNGMDP